MDNNSRFDLYVKAAKQFIERNGDCLVPAAHIEIYEGAEVMLGTWVCYCRQRRRKNQLSQKRILILEGLQGWTWGPLDPGPAINLERNKKIIEMRSSGSSLRQIADFFDLSRQRVHQIVGKPDDIQAS
jgi:hypothetical protein